MSKKITTLADLTPDPRNLNKHTQRGGGMAVKSIQECGLGRSIVVDRNGTIIGGNQVTETAAELGMDDVHVVQSDGRKLVVVQRMDLDLGAPDDDRARRLAVFDNRVAEVNLDWDISELQAMIDGGEDLSDMWTGSELEALLKLGEESLPDTPPEQQPSENYIIVVTCQTEAEQGDLLARFIADGIDCKALNS